MPSSQTTQAPPAPLDAVVRRLLVIRHPEWSHKNPQDDRGAIELWLRDAYAAGCNAAASKSLLTALEYAKREAPKLAATIADALHS